MQRVGFPVELENWRIPEVPQLSWLLPILGSHGSEIGKARRPLIHGSSLAPSSKFQTWPDNSICPRPRHFYFPVASYLASLRRHRQYHSRFCVLPISSWTRERPLLKDGRTFSSVQFSPPTRFESSALHFLQLLVALAAHPGDLHKLVCCFLQHLPPRTLCSDTVKHLHALANTTPSLMNAARTESWLRIHA
jgi:hypothetical protein